MLYRRIHIHLRLCCLLFAGIALWPCRGAAQPGSGWYVGGNLYGGIVVAHSEMVSNIEAHTWGGEVLLSRRMRNQNGWSANYLAPRYGIALHFTEYGQPDLMGQSFGLLPHIEFNLLKRPNYQATFRLGTGIGYFTRTFYTDDRMKSRAIGSRFNGNMHLGVWNHFALTDGLELNLGVAITHFSNGNVREPNWGVNTFTFGGGVQGLFAEESGPRSGPTDTGFYRKGWKGSLSLAWGTKQNGYLDGTRYSAWNIQATANNRLGPKSELLAGIDFFYDPIYPNYLYPDSIRTDEERDTDKLHLALLVGHELWLGKIAIMTHVGGYLYTPGNEYKPIYQRVGIKYRPFWWLYSSVSLKTHLSVAEFIEWRVGWYFGRKQ